MTSTSTCRITRGFDSGAARGFYRSDKGFANGIIPAYARNGMAYARSQISEAGIFELNEVLENEVADD
jgi:hypothetical protein